MTMEASSATPLHALVEKNKLRLRIQLNAELDTGRYKITLLYTAVRIKNGRLGHE